MKSRKGFTLVELLAMITVIGILMVIAVPNITGILEQSKKNQLEQDVIKMVNKAKIKMNTESFIEEPKEENDAVILTLSYLDDNQEIKKGPNGGYYYRYDSFVIVYKNNNTYKYYVRLIEEDDNYNYGVKGYEYSVFRENKEIGKIDNLYNFSKDTNINTISIENFTIKSYLAKEDNTFS